MSSIENEVCRKIQFRASFGLKKYGVTLERKDLSELDWLIHAQEEAMDLTNYLEVLIQKEKKMQKLKPGSVLTLKPSEEVYLEDREATIRASSLIERITTFLAKRFSYGGS